MKIGLIGNMNNNNFAFLRYLINLGYDANLIIFKNEISGNNKHFSPKADSWNIGKWKKYIIQSNLSEDPVSVFNFPISLRFLSTTTAPTSMMLPQIVLLVVSVS